MTNTKTPNASVPANIRHMRHLIVLRTSHTHNTSHINLLKKLRSRRVFLVYYLLVVLVHVLLVRVRMLVLFPARLKSRIYGAVCSSVGVISSSSLTAIAAAISGYV
jgi:hypothetical protein